MDKQSNLVNFTSLRDALAELDTLTSQPDGGKSKENRVKYLLAKIASLKAGYSHSELGRAEVIATASDPDEARRIAADFARSDNRPLTLEERNVAEAWSRFIRNKGVLEARDLGAGPVQASGPAGSGNFPFFPQEFFYNLTAVLKVHSPLFDDSFCTVIRTSHGRPIQVGYVADTDNVAVKITEGSQATEADPNTGGVMVFVDSYRTPLFKASLEAMNDIELSFGVANMASYFLGDRFARGAGRDLLLGAASGAGQNNATPGLVPRLRTAGAVTVVAQGSSANEGAGSAATGANSIGSDDLEKLFFSVNANYRKSPKCAWLMHPNTLQRLSALRTSNGLPLGLVVWKTADDSGVRFPHIFGKRVYEDPNLDTSHSGAFTVVFGDFSYWVTRIAQEPDRPSRIQVYLEAPGLVESGKFGLRLFGRAGGDLRTGASLTSPATSPFINVEFPLVLLEQASAA